MYYLLLLLQLGFIDVPNYQLVWDSPLPGEGVTHWQVEVYKESHQCVICHSQNRVQTMDSVLNPYVDINRILFCDNLTRPYWIRFDVKACNGAGCSEPAMLVEEVK